MLSVHRMSPSRLCRWVKLGAVLKSSSAFKVIFRGTRQFGASFSTGVCNPNTLSVHNPVRIAFVNVFVSRFNHVIIVATTTIGNSKTRKCRDASKSVDYLHGRNIWDETDNKRWTTCTIGVQPQRRVKSNSRVLAC
jgi:hypothetical protein